MSNTSYPIFSRKNSLVWITRPLNRAINTAKAFECEGYSTYIDSLLDIKILPIEQNDLKDHFDGMLITSANAIEAVGHLKSLKNKPLFCVGPASVFMAKSLGFLSVIESSHGFHAKGLMETILENRALKQKKIVYFRGEEIRLDIKRFLETKDFNIQERIVYKAVPRSRLLRQTQELLRNKQIKGVTLFSVRTTQIFLELLRQYKLLYTLENITALCLGDRIKEMIKALSWKDIKSASTTDELVANFR